MQGGGVDEVQKEAASTRCRRRRRHFSRSGSY
jgi:hypothetical protein